MCTQKKGIKNKCFLYQQYTSYRDPCWHWHKMKQPSMMVKVHEISYAEGNPTGRENGPQRFSEGIV